MRNRNWVFGNNAGLDFSTNPPTPFSNRPINTYEGCASISDGKGKLIIYSDGVRVWDATGTVRATGLGLDGHNSSTQSALIVPDPATPDRYYIFTSDGSSGANKHVNGIRLTIGSWIATPLAQLMKMPPTARYSATERLVAVRHKNGKDFWVLTIIQAGKPVDDTSSAPGLLRVFKVTAAGVSYVGDQSLNHTISDMGHLKANKNGTHIAVADLWSKRVLVYPFSPATGLINVGAVINIPVTVPPFNTGGFPYGVEFSPRGKFLYYSTLFPLPISVSPTSDSHIFQVDLATGTQILVGTHPNDPVDTSVGALQLGFYNQIYISQDGENQLGIITKPDWLGVACNVQFSTITLAQGSNCRAGLPNMIRDLI
jgi:hypothetical protein